MTDSPDREDIIRYRLEQYVFNDLAVGVGIPTIDEWTALEGDLRFGWMPPRDTDEGIVVIFQPEIMSLVTDTLSDEDFDAYVTTVEWMIARHVSLLIDGVEVTERTRIIESELYDLNPAALRFQSDVEMAFAGGGP